MNAKPIRLVFTCILAFVVLGGFFSASTVRADTPPDILDSYTIAIAPQPDGTLVMNYTLAKYCTYSDWPSDQPYLQIGVPNGNFAISDWGPKDGTQKVVKAESITDGGSFVQLDFDKSNLPKNGDCFDLYFAIVQSKMAYPDPDNGNVTFKFIPAGWKFAINVKTLTVSWALPSDTSLLKVVDPKPVSQDEANMVWTWTNPAMDASNMFHDSVIKLAYDKSAFTLSDAAKTDTDAANGVAPFDWSFCCTVLIIIAVVLLILFFVLVIAEAYESGDGIGPAFITVTGSLVDAALSDGGGSGGSSGHGSGCACAGCACACACAGGGKVGCSRKAIGISCLPKVISEMEKEGGG
jgi:hypothetical protein